MNFWRFVAHGSSQADPGHLLRGTYDIPLVLVSVAVATLAAYAALTVVDRMVATPRRRMLWLAAGATAMGSGIWAMHFVGMLAFRMPVHVHFSVWITLISVLPSVVGSGAALHVLSRESVGWLRLHLGGLMLAIGIGSMHYVGMEAVLIDGVMTYQPWLFILSIVVAYALATAALYARIVLKRRLTWLCLPISALVLGSAVAGMHYTAMSAAIFYSGGHHGDHGLALPPTLLALLICLFVAFILGLTIVSTIVHRRLTSTAASLAESAARHAAVLETMADGLLTFDVRGRIDSTNAASQRILGVTEDVLLTMNVEQVLPGCLARATADSATARVHAEHEIDAPLPGGGTVPLALAIGRMHMDDRVLFNVVLRDVTERRQADAAIRAHVSEVEHAHRKLADQAQALQQQAIELAEARDRAEAGARAKADFLAAMSHEIRTPMNGVLGMARMLTETELLPQQRDYAETIHSSGLALLGVINDILDFSKIEAGKLDIEPVPFDLQDASGDVIDLLLTTAGSKSIELTMNVEPGLPRYVIGDPGRFRQILLNLVTNAIKFTHEGHVRIRLGGSARNGRAAIRLEVTDTGIGMTGEQLGRLFQAFSQADSSITRKYGGTGLGLAICKRLVDLMGGRIGVTSAPSRGSLFWFELDLPTCDGPSIAADEPRQRTAAPAPIGTAAVLRVLLAEDNIVNQKVATHMLTRLGCTVDVAANGAEAVDLWARLPYDVILMDCQMPELDGFAATRLIRARERHGGRIPIVALTASAMQGDRDVCLEAGMDDHVTKPVSIEKLSTALEQFALTRS